MKKAVLYICVLLSFASVLNAQESSVTRVFEYKPAPGQFINLLPAYADGDDEEDLCRKCLESLNSSQLISLGGFGGSVVVGFDHSILNLPGEYDFNIQGNAMDGRSGISSEPGIVLVSVDANQNGLPDDEWYELKGSDYNNPLNIRNYAVTYTKPAQDDEDVKWRDNQNKNGVIQHMSSQGHNQAHYPLWVTDRELTFAGTRLPDNAVKIGDNPERWKQTAFGYGYADNKPNDTDGTKFNIDWAVNRKGENVSLSKIDFIKVYTAIHQQCGWLGELSTEILSIYDLHPTATSIQSAYLKPEIFYQDGNLMINTQEECTLNIYTPQGLLLKSFHAPQGESLFPLSLPHGIYICGASRTGSASRTGRYDKRWGQKIVVR